MLKGREFIKAGTNRPATPFDTYIYGLGATITKGSNCEAPTLSFFFHQILYSEDIRLDDDTIIDEINTFAQNSQNFCDMAQTINQINLGIEHNEHNPEIMDSDQVKSVFNALSFWRVFGSGFGPGGGTPMDIEGITKPVKIVVFLMFENWRYTHAIKDAIEIIGDIGPQQSGTIIENDIFAEFDILNYRPNGRPSPPLLRDRVMKFEYWHNTANFPHTPNPLREFIFDLSFVAENSSTVSSPITIDPKIRNG